MRGQQSTPEVKLNTTNTLLLAPPLWLKKMKGQQWQCEMSLVGDKYLSVCVFIIKVHMLSHTDQ